MVEVTEELVEEEYQYDEELEGGVLGGRGGGGMGNTYLVMRHCFCVPNEKKEALLEVIIKSQMSLG